MDWDRETRHEENRRLLAEARSGDPDAAWRLILNYQPLIRAEIVKVIDDSRLRDRAEHTDAWSHEVMMLARKAFDQFSGEYPQFSSWLRATARNYAVRQAQREQRIQATVVLADGPTSQMLPTAPAAETVVIADFDADARDAQTQVMHECLHELKRSDPAAHELIWLRHVCKMSHKEILQILVKRDDHIALGTVGARIRAAQVELRHLMRDWDRRG